MAPNMPDRIVTHFDLDGIATGAMASFFYKITKIFFTGPSDIYEGRFKANDNDIVCDLPYPLGCALWFDHHQGNYDELTLRSIDPDTINGLFKPYKSCSSVILEHLKEKMELPDRFFELATETDRIDSFTYDSIFDWKKERPGRIIDCAIKFKKEPRDKHILFLKELLFLLRDNDIGYVSNLTDVKNKYHAYEEDEGRMIELIKTKSIFIQEDINKECLFIDISDFPRPISISKNLANIIYPSVKVATSISSVFDMGRRSTNLVFSSSLMISQNIISHNKDLGEIMRILNIGDGHKGAASGRINSNNKTDSLKKKEEYMRKFFNLWKKS